MMGKNKASAWNPQQYHKYQAYRSRPARDLINQLPSDGVSSIVDLGCGPGDITELLKARYPKADILGVDNSKPMLEAARQKYPEQTWLDQDIASTTGRFDLIFSNAALQWLPDHKKLLAGLFDCLNPGAYLAIQMPRNAELLSHKLLTDTVESFLNRFPQLKQHIRKNPVQTPQEYFEIFSPLGALCDIWETTYLHELIGDNPVLEWVKGSALSPMRGTLSHAEYREFEQAYGKKLQAAYPKMPNGSTLFPFKRIFMVVKKA